MAGTGALLLNDCNNASCLILIGALSSVVLAIVFNFLLKALKVNMMIYYFSGLVIVLMVYSYVQPLSLKEKELVITIGVQNQKF